MCAHVCETFKETLISPFLYLNESFEYCWLYSCSFFCLGKKCFVSVIFQIHMIKDNGELSTVTLGDVVRHVDCVGQVVVPHDTWYAAELEEGSQYSLYSAVVMPGTYTCNLQRKVSEVVLPSSFCVEVYKYC